MSEFLKIIKKRIEKGLCPNCGKERMPGCFRCNDCGIKHRIKERTRRGLNSYLVNGMDHNVKYQGEE